eukprot:471736-Amphidinium_carterae.1
MRQTFCTVKRLVSMTKQKKFTISESVRELSFDIIERLFNCLLLGMNHRGQKKEKKQICGVVDESRSEIAFKNIFCVVSLRV